MSSVLQEPDYLGKRLANLYVRDAERAEDLCVTIAGDGHLHGFKSPQGR